MPDFNQQIIDEFHANGGQVGGMFEHATLLLLHHRGAKTGTERVSPLGYLPLGDTFAIFATKAGAPTNPAWYYNLVANPSTNIEVGTETIPVRARVAEGDERERIWTTQKERVPQMADYEQKTTRRIPVIVLERA
ncbi:MAG TPA: nitroreductase family deazaflavin-dependent oxidoreductase [Acidimicrobiia bacterium]